MTSQPSLTPRHGTASPLPRLDQAHGGHPRIHPRSIKRQRAGSHEFVEEVDMAGRLVNHAPPGWMVRLPVGRTDAAAWRGAEAPDDVPLAVLPAAGGHQAWG